jgi:hypothetical protein
MDFDKYINKLTCPRISNYTFFLYYDRTDKKEVEFPIAKFLDERYVLLEETVDPKYQEDVNSYNYESNQLKNQFKVDLFKENNVPFNSATEKVFELAWSEDSYSKIARRFKDFVEIYKETHKLFCIGT